MKTFTLIRASDPTDSPTFGRIEDAERKQVCVTLELPWADNAHNESCIPPGVYPAHRYLSPKRGYEVFMLDGVPHRSSIELHIGNYVHDTDGCVLLGTAFGILNGQHGITGSADAFRKFMNLCAGEQNIVLTVTSPAPLTAEPL